MSDSDRIAPMTEGAERGTLALAPKQRVHSGDRIGAGERRRVRSAAHS
jgi:hypothetical protein